MLRLARLLLLLTALGCARRAPHDHLAFEASFLRLGVDRKAEEREVRRVLGQRKLDVVSEVRAREFVALGAEGPDGKVTAVRVITGRGVVLAEDALFDDLFAPGRVTLLDDFAPELNELSLVGVVRVAARADAGCLSLWRILPDGQAAQVVLDVSDFGSRACVSSLSHAGRGRLAAEVGFPGLSAGQTPRLSVELGFQTIALGKPDPAVRVARPLENSDALTHEQKRLGEASCAGTPFAERHALSVARAALAHFTGQATDRQLDAYRECVGSVTPGSDDAAGVAEAVQHIEHGWLDGAGQPDPDAPDGGAGDGADSDAVVIEPSPAPHSE